MIDIINKMSTEELLDFMPPRNKYWEIHSRWSNDWWLTITQSGSGSRKSPYGGMKNMWRAEYTDDNDVPIRSHVSMFPTLKEALIDLLLFLKEEKIFNYEDRLKLKR